MSPACRAPSAAIPPIRPRQPRPRPPPATDHRATPGRQRRQQRRPTLHSPRARPRPTHTQPPNRGFCTIRRTATACRRRVAPLVLQFPPLTREGTTAAPPSAPPSALAGTSDAPPRPAAAPPAQRLHFPAAASGQSVARRHGGNFGLHPLFSRNEIRSTQLTQTVTNRSSTH